MDSYGNLSGYRPSRTRRGRARRPRQYSIVAFVLAYLGAVAGCVLAAALTPVLLLIAYPLAGIVLSRFIGRRIEWWNQSNNLSNVAATKLSTILRWPLAVPLFIVQVFIAKYL